MVKAWTDAAWEDFEYWTREDKKTFRRILQLLKDIDRKGMKASESQNGCLGIWQDIGAGELMEKTGLYIRLTEIL